MPFSVTNVFAANQVVTAAQLNQNFDDIEAKINGNINPVDLQNPYAAYAMTWSRTNLTNPVNGDFAKMRVHVASIPVGVNAKVRTKGASLTKYNVDVINVTQSTSIMTGVIDLNAASADTITAGTTTGRTILAADVLVLRISTAGGTAANVDNDITVFLKAIHQT